MRIQYEPLSELLELLWQDNPKEHDLQELDASLKRFGYTTPVMKDEGTGKIVAGHGRLTKLGLRKAEGEELPERLVLREDGEWLVPVIRGVRFASPEEARAYIIADNRISELGGWNDELLAGMLKEARDGAGLLGTGFSEAQTTDLLAAMAKNALPPTPGEAPPPPEDFREFDAGQKKTVACPKCGFHVPTA